MTTEGFHRKLTAILSADVQGYSRLMEDDEEGTVRTLTAYRDLMSVLIQRHQGRVVDSPGDNLLAEFNSLTDAVHCAVEIQEELRISNADLPDNRKMHFRIGINLGEIIEDRDRIYGDGVNVAARLEGLADGGGICISGAVYDAIKNKLAMSYEFMGEYNVKNIKEPVRIYRIRVEPEVERAVKKEKKAVSRTWRWAAIAGMAVIVLGAVAYLLFDNLSLDRQAVKPEVVTKVPENAPLVVNETKAKKTIAVLPFVNMSSDPEQEYFVDGLSEELLNSLAQMPDLTVIARTSAFTFKNSDKKVQEIASELGVENILEGSVRKAGNALRITAQLVKGVDGSHLWSKTYDRELKDIFAIQEDISTAVVNELKVKLGVGQSLKHLGGTDNVEAYDLYLLALEQWNAGGFSLALKNIDAAIALDPEFALAWVWKSGIHNINRIRGPADLSASELDEAQRAILKAIELEPNLADAYEMLGLIRVTQGEFLKAASAYRKASELSNRPTGVIFDNSVLLQEAGYLKMAHEIMIDDRLTNPIKEDTRGDYIQSLAFTGDMKGAEEEYKSGKAMFGDGWFNGNMAITLARLGSGQAVSSDDIVISEPIHNAAKEHLNSPKEGLVELHRFYNDNDYHNTPSLTSIAYWAAYFGDPDFSMNAIEKAVNIDAMTVRNYWLPLFKDVRQLPRFKKLVKKIGIVDLWNEFGWPDVCHKLNNGDFECD